MPTQSEADAKVLYTASYWRTLVVRILAWAGVPIAIAGLWWGISILGQPTHRPSGERVELENEPYLVGPVVILSSAVVAGGLILFPLLYVLRVERAGDRITIDTAKLLGRRRIRISRKDIRGVRYWEGKMRTQDADGMYSETSTPSLLIRVAGQRLPLIADLQGCTLDETGMYRLGQE